MSFYIYVTYLLLAIASGQKIKLKTVNGIIKISVGTSAGCRDTHRFLIEDLIPTYNKYKNFLKIQFIPWGRTKRHPNGSLTCQHGISDCFANKVQRCALSMLRNNQEAQIKYMKCEFSNPYPAYLQGNYNCAVEFGLRLINVGNCALRPYGRLDMRAEEATRYPLQVIDFVPTIWFNDQPDYALHREALYRLPHMVCSALAEDPKTGVTCNK